MTTAGKPRTSDALGARRPRSHLIRRLPRRTLLRGALGAAVSLPLFEAMQERSARGQFESPRRIVFEFKPNGDHVASRFTREGATDFAFGDFLAPLERYRDELVVLHRLDKRFGNFMVSERGDRHQEGTMALAPWPQGEGDFTVFGEDRRIGYVLGPSVDTVIGEFLLQRNPALAYRQLVYRVGGLQNNINNHTAHAGPVGTQNPIPPETDPIAAYLRLFGDGTDDDALSERLIRQQSVLDLVIENNTALAKQLGAGDRMRLEQYSESLREVERALVPRRNSGACEPIPLELEGNVYLDAGHVAAGAAFHQLIALALACDLTRCVNFAWAGGVSTRTYRELGITEPHHDLSHISTEAAYAQIRSIHRHLWENSVRLFDLLKATPEGAGTLWDTTLVVHWNELGQGDVHSIDDQLVVLASGLPSLERGRFHDLRNEAGFSQMLLTCMHAMGMDEPSFGDLRLAEGGGLSGVLG